MTAFTSGKFCFFQIELASRPHSNLPLDYYNCNRAYETMASMEISNEQAVNSGYAAEEIRNMSSTIASAPLPEAYDSSHMTFLADGRPVLPAFWGNAQESPHRAAGDTSSDVWRELNSDSPSILRLQCLWAYFNLPALSLADSVAGVASVAAQTDGFHSVVQVSSPLLHG